MDIIFISYLGLFYPFSDDGGGAGAGWIAVEKAAQGCCPMAALFGIRALLTARLVMRTLIAQPGEPHRLLLEPTNGGNREKCILRAAITYFGVSPAHVFHVLARRKCAQQYAAESAPPPAFFPCNLCPAYLWPDICLPAAIYGGRDNSNKGAATPHLDGCLALAGLFFRHLPTKQNFSTLSSGWWQTFSCCAVAENAEILRQKMGNCAEWTIVLRPPVGQ